MALIESDDAAVRLARAIVRDIELYNAPIITAGADLSEAITEGRELYRSRVAERFHAFFEDALMARDLSRLDGTPALARPAAPHTLGTPAPKRFGPPATHESFLAPLPATSGGGAWLGMLVLGSLLLVAAVAWLTLDGR